MKVCSCSEVKVEESTGQYLRFLEGGDQSSLIVSDLDTNICYVRGFL